MIKKILVLAIAITLSATIVNACSTQKDKSLNNFINLLGQSVAASQEKISIIMQQEDNLLQEIQNKVEKK